MPQDNQTPLPAASQASRRALLMGFAAAATPMAPALANALSEPAPAEADPVIAAIEDHKAALAEFYRLVDVLEEAEHDAREEHGHRPFALIQWRNYCIGGAEIDRARLEFLRVRRANSKRIEKEYRDAKARYAAALRAGEDWDERTGIAPLREQRENAKAAELAAAERLAATKPTTPAGASALVAYVTADIGEDIDIDWHRAALHTVAEALNTFTGAQA
jgi:hypothetical protein